MSITTIAKEDLVQEQILKAAKKLFALYGLAKINMDDISKAIGKTRGSIYYYYKSKEEIIEAVISMEISEVRTAMEKAVSQATTAEGKIHAFFVSKLKLARKKRSFFDALESGMDADAISNFNKTKVAYHSSTLKWEGALLTQILKGGIVNGELKNIEKKEMANLVFVLLSTLHGLKREMRIGKNSWAIEAAVDQLTRMIMHGLAK